jgi:hypothetical protein
MHKIQPLRHGGIIANYRCNAACRHCLYSCSPERDGAYIAKDAARDICALLRESGCRLMHIGGGEPFLDFNGLLTLINTVRNAGIALEYIETNAFWATEAAETAERLGALKQAGADAFCISVDPFHIEYVPLARPLFLAEMCRQEGFGYFLWQERFVPLLSKLDAERTYTRAELEAALSPDYIEQTARRYGLRMGGRAQGIEREYGTLKPTETLSSGKPCSGLLSGSHFHVDVYGRYIPPGCTGIAIPLEEAVRGIPAGKYPVLEALTEGGTAKLLSFAQSKGFVAGEAYTSACALCISIRSWLSVNADCLELDPEHYNHSL